MNIIFLVFGTGAEELQRLRDEATSDAEEKNEDPPSFNCGSLYFKFIIKVKVIFSLKTLLILSVGLPNRFRKFGIGSGSSVK